MVSMRAGWVAAVVAGLMAGVAGAQAPVSGTGTTAAAPQAGSAQASSGKDPFPPVDPKFFTATSPTVETVDGFLRALWGYDPSRRWRVAAIQATQAPGVSKVTVFVADRTPDAKVQTSSFFVTPDGAHAIAGDGIVAFGAHPFSHTREVLAQRADGPYRGSASKALELVEFSDLQCPHCKDAQGTMDQLVKDFPNARVVYQTFPLAEIHPFALKAAAYGVCVAKQKPDAFFPYVDAVFATQGGLTAEDGDQTLKNAVVKAGGDAAAVDVCAATPATKDAVMASVKLGTDVGVDQTPLLAVNGHLLPLTSIPYETLKQMVVFEAAQDGVK